MTLERTLRIVLDDHQVPVAVRIHAPERAPDTDFVCRVEIDWPEGTWRGTSVGVDTCQAVFLAFQLVGTRLYNSEHHHAGRLMWTEPGAGYGFPVPHTIRDFLVGDDRTFVT
jgi:hypothetical protein